MRDARSSESKHRMQGQDGEGEMTGEIEKDSRTVDSRRLGKRKACKTTWTEAPESLRCQQQCDSVP